MTDVLGLSKTTITASIGIIGSINLITMNKMKNWKPGKGTGNPGKK